MIGPARPIGGAVVAIAALGAAHASLLALLAAGGHQPGFAKGLPVAAEDYYGVAAFYVIPLYFALWWLAAVVSHGAASAFGGRGASSGTLRALGPAYALPTLALFIVPDLVVYLAAGHGALVAAMRWYAPLAPIAVLLFATRALRREHGLRRWPAFAAALAGFVAQALPAVWLLR